MLKWNNAINEIERQRKLGLIPSVRQVTPKEVGDLISEFISKHATLRADFDASSDDEEDIFASPDASNLSFAAKSLLENGGLPEHYRCTSSWESGGYKPYDSISAREEHDAIVKLCRAYQI